MDDSKIIMLPENQKSFDPSMLLAMNNGGFGGFNNPLWMMFMLPFLYPFFGMFGGWGNGGFGFGGNNGGTGFLANQLNNDAGRDLILQAINGRADALGQLANILNTDVATVQSGINTANLKLQEIGSQVGLTGLQVINSIQSGNASLASQLAQCCCENRLLTTQQGYESQIRTLEQTNQLGSQADRNTRSITDAIAAQSTMITKEFCDLKERDMQDKINALTAENATLKTTMNNNAQTAQFAAMLAPIQSELVAIKANQPQTITLPYNQYTAVPTLVANAGADFIASYWANRLTQATTPTTPTTPTNA